MHKSRVRIPNCLNSLNISPLTRFSVPKDYFNASAGVSTVALAVYRAKTRESRGTIFLGAGGPGGSGVRMAYSMAEAVSPAGDRLCWKIFIYGVQFSDIVLGQYDIVGYDPRGVGESRYFILIWQRMITQE